MIHIITEKPIFDYATKHPEHKVGLETWVSLVKGSTWNKPQDIIMAFGAKAVDLIGNSRVVIDMKGNHIRVIAKYQIHIKLKKSQLYIKWIGSHSDYDKLNKLGLQHTVDMYK